MIIILSKVKVKSVYEPSQAHQEFYSTWVERGIVRVECFV